MERRVGKLMRKFLLPENANTDQISAACQDDVFTEFLWSRISLERKEILKCTEHRESREIQNFSGEKFRSAENIQRNLVKIQRIQNFSGEKFRSPEKFLEFLWREISMD
ncbi:hypothetical protein ACSBR1_005725 [Camellia fascicularis]